MKIPICKTSQLDERPLKQFQVNGKKILISRAGDQYYGTSAICTHEETPLEEGWVEDTTLTCEAHEAQFDLVTGAVKALPATRPLRIYNISVEGDTIYLIE